MRVRSVALVLAMSGLLAGSILRCSPPPLPLGPQAIPTQIRLVDGVIIKVPASGAIDRTALVASLKDAKIRTVILHSSSTAGAELVNAQVSLAVELQSQVEGDVYIGMDQATAQITVEALRTTDPSKRIGCFITQQPELVDRLADDAKATLNAQLRDGASSCAADGRHVAISPLLTTRSGDPDTAGVVLREVLRNTGISVVILEDGVAIDSAAHADAGLRRAKGYYQGLRNALADRQVELGGALLVDRLVDGGQAPRTMAVWANIEAYDCVPPDCAKTHPTTTTRLIEQLCGARFRVDSIVAVEYLHDLAARPLFVFDASSDAALPDDLQTILDDSDASTQLRKGYLEWRDSGAVCPAERH